MKRYALRHLLFTSLTTIMCFSFCGYILLNHYEIVKEVNVSLTEEDTETAEKSINEVNKFYVYDDLSLNAVLVSITKQTFHYRNEQLPHFHLTPNTPPPNLA